MVAVPDEKKNEKNVFTPQEITAMALCRLKELIEAFLGRKIFDCVISVPASFTETQQEMQVRWPDGQFTNSLMRQ